MQDVVATTQAVVEQRRAAGRRPKRMTPAVIADMALLAAIAAVGVALRLYWALTVPNQPISDFHRYQSEAASIFHQQDVPGIAYNGVGYPLALGMFYRLVGSSDVVVGKLFNVILSFATLVLTYFILRKLTANRWIVYAATAAVALLPEYVAYTSVLGTEVLFTFLFAVALLLQLYRFDARIRYPLLGVVIGAGALVKPYFLAYPIVVVLVEWFVMKDWRKALASLAIPTAFMLLVLLPVTYKNYQQFHTFVLNTYNGGMVLFLNSNDDNKTGAWMPASDIHISPAFRAELLQRGVTYPTIPTDERFAPLEPLFRAEAERWIIGHPLQFIELGFLRLYNTFFAGAWDIRSWGANGVSVDQINNSRGLKIFFFGANVGEYLLSSAGVIYLLVGLLLMAQVAVRRRTSLPVGIAAPAMIMAFFMAVTFVTEGQPRYGFPVLFLEIFCVANLVAAFAKGIREVALGADTAPNAVGSLFAAAVALEAGQYDQTIDRREQIDVRSHTGRVAATVQDRERLDRGALRLSGPLTLRGLSVVLPAYNEEVVIVQTVRRCVEALSVVAPDFEIIVVDDGSRDRTGEIADELAASNPCIRVVHNKPNRGYGGALISGFQAATKALTFFMDSDGQFDIADIAKLLPYREEGYHAVLGYRERRMDAFVRRLNAKGWKMLVSLLLGLRVRDIDCAFKLYDTALVRLLDVTSEGAMINTEMLIKLNRLGIPLVEVPVRHYPRVHGRATGANPKVIAHAFGELLRLRGKLRPWAAVAPHRYEPDEAGNRAPGESDGGAGAQ